MGRNLIVREPPVSDQLHPLIFAGIGALLVVFVLSAVAAFATSGYADYLLVVVAGFFVVAMTIPWLLWRVWRRYSGERLKSEPLREWSAGECDTWQCRLSAREAAVQTLLPIAAVSFGLTAIAIVMLLVEHNAV